MSLFCCELWKVFEGWIGFFEYSNFLYFFFFWKIIFKKTHSLHTAPVVILLVTLRIYSSSTAEGRRYVRGEIFNRGGNFKSFLFFLFLPGFDIVGYLAFRI